MIGFRGEMDPTMRGIRFNQDEANGGTPNPDDDTQRETFGSNDYFSYEIIEYPINGESGQKGAIVLITALDYSTGSLFGNAMNAVATYMRKIQELALANCPADSQIDLILELGKLSVPNPVRSAGVTAEVDTMATLTLETYPNVRMHVCADKKKLGTVRTKIWDLFAGSIEELASKRGYIKDKAIVNHGAVTTEELNQIIDDIKAANKEL